MQSPRSRKLDRRSSDYVEAKASIAARYVPDDAWRDSAWGPAWLFACWTVSLLLLILSIFQENLDVNEHDWWPEYVPWNRGITRNITPNAIRGGWPAANNLVRIFGAVCGVLVGVGCFYRLDRAGAWIMTFGGLSTNILIWLALSLDAGVSRRTSEIECDTSIAVCSDRLYYGAIVLNNVLGIVCLLHLLILLVRLYRRWWINGPPGNKKSIHRARVVTRVVSSILVILCIASLVVTLSQINPSATITYLYTTNETPRDVYLLTDLTQGLPQVFQGSWPPSNTVPRIILVSLALASFTMGFIPGKKTINEAGLCCFLYIIIILASLAQFIADLVYMERCLAYTCPPGYECSYLNFWLTVILDFWLCLMTLSYLVAERVIPAFYRLSNPTSINIKIFKRLAKEYAAEIQHQRAEEERLNPRTPTEVLERSNPSQPIPIQMDDPDRDSDRESASPKIIITPEDNDTPVAKDKGKQKLAIEHPDGNDSFEPQEEDPEKGEEAPELWPYLGLMLEDDIDPRDDTLRATVVSINDGGPAAEGDIQVDDIITKFDGQILESKGQFGEFLCEVEIGSTVVLEVYRSSVNGLVDCEVVVGYRQATPMAITDP